MWQARLFKVSLQRTSSRGPFKGPLQGVPSKCFSKGSLQIVSPNCLSKVRKRFGLVPALLRSLDSAHDLVDQRLHGNIVRNGRVIEADPVAEDLMAELLDVVRGDIGATVHQGGSLGDL